MAPRAPRFARRNRSRPARRAVRRRAETKNPYAASRFEAFTAVIARKRASRVVAPVVAPRKRATPRLTSASSSTLLRDARFPVTQNKPNARLGRWGAGTSFDATAAADDGELDLVPGAASVDPDAVSFALAPGPGSNPRGGGGGGFFGAHGMGPVAPGSPTQASHAHRRGAPNPQPLGAFSFEPEDDPVVCAAVNAAQERARASVAAAREAEARAAAEAEARRREESAPAALAQRRAADLERRLNAKRKYAELASVVERLAVRAETHGAARDALSATADAATSEARDAERRRKAAMAASSGSGGRRPAGGSHGNLAAALNAAAPFDVAAFASLAARRELEILHKQGLTSLKQLMNHKWAFPFNAPVDHVALGLTNYLDVVKRPMDLGTVRRKLERSGGGGDADGSADASTYAPYANCEELNRDVMLTFANAKLYNPPPTDVHVMATALEEFWAPRWEALRIRSNDVSESLAAERECAVKNSEEIKARRRLANEEMRCAGVAADLDAARRRLEDLKRSASRTARPMTEPEFDKLTKSMRSLPRGYRAVARDLVAETEGAHRVPVDGVARWSEVLEDLKTFNGIAHRRLARFAKVRRRNRAALARGFCHTPVAGFDCGEGEEYEFLDPDATGDLYAPNGAEKKTNETLSNGDEVKVSGAPHRNGDATPDAAEGDAGEKVLAAAAAAAAAAADGGSRDSDATAAGGAGAPGGEDPLMALALGGGDWQGGGAAAQSEPELVRLVSGGGQ